MTLYVPEIKGLVIYLTCCVSRPMNDVAFIASSARWYLPISRGYLRQRLFKGKEIRTRIMVIRYREPLRNARYAVNESREHCPSPICPFCLYACLRISFIYGPTIPVSGRFTHSDVSITSGGALFRKVEQWKLKNRGGDSCCPSWFIVVETRVEQKLCGSFRLDVLLSY